MSTEEEVKATPEEKLTDSQMKWNQEYFAHLVNASNMLSVNPTMQAIQARIKIEEALLWGRIAISSWNASTPESFSPPMAVQ